MVFFSSSPLSSLPPSPLLGVGGSAVWQLRVFSQMFALAADFVLYFN